VTTRDRGRSRARGAEKARFRAPFTGYPHSDGRGSGVDGGEDHSRG
jgi:hypothetical protein